MGLLFVLLLAGAAFIAMGILVLRKLGRPATFDLTLGVYWKGRRRRSLQIPHSELRTPHCVSLADVHALQIVSDDHESEDSDGRKHSYRSYELNLILTDAVRVNVIDHGNGDQLRRDAQALAKFLGIPLWDAS